MPLLCKLTNHLEPDLLYPGHVPQEAIFLCLHQIRARNHHDSLEPAGIIQTSQSLTVYPVVLPFSPTENPVKVLALAFPSLLTSLVSSPRGAAWHDMPPISRTIIINFVLSQASPASSLVTAPDYYIKEHRTPSVLECDQYPKRCPFWESHGVHWALPMWWHWTPHCVSCTGQPSAPQPFTFPAADFLVGGRFLGVSPTRVVRSQSRLQHMFLHKFRRCPKYFPNVQVCSDHWIMWNQDQTLLQIEKKIIFPTVVTK